MPTKILVVDDEPDLDLTKSMDCNALKPQLHAGSRPGGTDDA